MLVYNASMSKWQSYLLLKVDCWTPCGNSAKPPEWTVYTEIKRVVSPPTGEAGSRENLVFLLDKWIIHQLKRAEQMTRPVLLRSSLVNTLQNEYALPKADWQSNNTSWLWLTSCFIPWAPIFGKSQSAYCILCGDSCTHLFHKHLHQQPNKPADMGQNDEARCQSCLHYPTAISCLTRASLSLAHALAH